MTPEDKTSERATEEREVDSQAILKAKELILALANTSSFSPGLYFKTKILP